jgi:hypothetical protein
MRHNIKKFSTLLLVFLVDSFFLFSTHNASRYFPFIEQTEKYPPRKKSYLYGDLFFNSASTAFNRDGGNVGIPELWGTYCLKDIIESLRVTQVAEGVNFIDPIDEIIGKNTFNNQETKFGIREKIKSIGIMLGYEKKLPWHNLSVGLWVPAMHVNATMRYDLKKSDGKRNSVREKQLDKVRRITHDKIGFFENDWSAGGFGDIDLHLRWNYFLDHEFMLRSVSINPQIGILIPTGVKADKNNPASIPFMGNGHWGTYFVIASELELKQDLKAGFIFGGIHQFKKKHITRIPTYKEPAIFSSLVGKVDIKPGFTAKISPYITLENLTDGVHFQAKYTYLRHSKDLWEDVRFNKAIESYLTKKPSAKNSQEDIDKNIEYKKYLSKWRAHYMTLQLTYESKQALHNWNMNPNLYVAYDIPIGGRGVSKTHKIVFGVELNF